MTAAVNYVEETTFVYDEYAVTPDIDFGTIARFTGKWEVKIIVCEWCTPDFIQQKINSLTGWVVEVDQPAKPAEELDMLNVTITARKRTA